MDTGDKPLHARVGRAVLTRSFRILPMHHTVVLVLNIMAQIFTLQPPPPDWSYGTCRTDGIEYPARPFGRCKPSDRFWYQPSRDIAEDGGTQTR